MIDIVESVLTVPVCSVSDRSSETGRRLRRQARPARAKTGGRVPHIVWGLACGTLSDFDRFRVERHAPSGAEYQKEPPTQERTRTDNI